MMKRIKNFIALVAFFGTTLAFAQAPEKMSYQAVIRNVSNDLVSNQSIGMRISILQGSVSGSAAYVETQTPTTNANGLVSIEIGAGSAVTGTFSAIDWSDGPYFVKTEADPTGGSTYTVTGTSQLLSTPYALYAKTSGSSTPGPQGPAGNDGLDGATGPMGPQGPAGNDGLDGATGPMGPQGPAGNDGLDGATGPMGPQGPAGNDGLDGATGPMGPQGPAGNDGLDGATGPMGPQGPAGNDGLDGATGPMGPQGPQGATGAAGSNGQGVPTGGTANQVLAKVDGTNYNTQWVTPSGGGGAIQFYGGISSNLALASGSQDLVFNNPVVNLGSQMSAGTFTATTAGYYLVTFQCYSTYSAVTANNPFLKLNGTITYYGSTATNTNMQTSTQCVFSQIIKLNANDAIKPGVWTSTANATLQSGASTYFSVYKL